MHAVCFFHKKVKKQQKKTLPGVNINDILFFEIMVTPLCAIFYF